MLTCQLMMAALSAVKRFDALVLHFRSSFARVLSVLRLTGPGGEAEY